jgi:hypothetical protein
MDWLSAFGVGLCGGFAISILDHAALANVAKRDRRVSFSDPAYLFKFFGHPLAGAFLAAVVAASRPGTVAAEAAFIGAAAPGLWRVIARSGRSAARQLVKDMANTEEE